MNSTAPGGGQDNGASRKGRGKPAASAIITGGAKGIGLAIARRLAADGAVVALIGRDAAALERAATELNARYAVADVIDPTALRDAIAALGPCDILVNNAGAALSKPFAKHTLDDFQSMLAINLLAAVAACGAVLPHMRAQNFGRIVNIASTAGLKGYHYVTAYVAAKHALVGFTRALALESVKHGITVNAVCPGFTDTDMTARSAANIATTTGRSKQAARDALAATNPAGRLVRPEEVADTVAFLCRAEASAITGQAIVVANGEL
jgi:NAD(P)-dependent dehydrogenase (short-subunit alcohol dehydrogenase family)